MLTAIHELQVDGEGDEALLCALLAEPGAPGKLASHEGLAGNLVDRLLHVETSASQAGSHEHARHLLETCQLYTEPGTHAAVLVSHRLAQNCFALGLVDEALAAVEDAVRAVSQGDQGGAGLSFFAAHLLKLKILLRVRGLQYRHWLTRHEHCWTCTGVKGVPLNVYLLRFESTPLASESFSQGLKIASVVQKGDADAALATAETLIRCPAFEASILNAVTIDAIHEADRHTARRLLQKLYELTLPQGDHPPALDVNNFQV